jgi:hypothetical protein
LALCCMLTFVIRKEHNDAASVQLPSPNVLSLRIFIFRHKAKGPPDSRN